MLQTVVTLFRYCVVRRNSFFLSYLNEIFTVPFTNLLSILASFCTIKSAVHGLYRISLEPHVA